MKQDNQHLDFLLSQYVDGTLEGAGKKSVEQQMLNSPDARQLYVEHREVQDLLDDMGNRIPLIDWADFDQKLSLRLEQETVDIARRSQWRRWMKPVAAAAALFVAAGIGYGWNTWWAPRATVDGVNSGPVVQSGPRMDVKIEGLAQQTQPSRIGFSVDEPAAMGGFAPQDPRLAAERVAVTAPQNSAATGALLDSMRFGLGNLNESSKAPGTVGASKGVAIEAPKTDGPVFP